MRFWVDIANSPHATLFGPIVEELGRRGHDTIVTAWDRAQTRELALARWPEALVVGAGSERGLLAKASRIARRAAALARAVEGRRPDVALGHNSYAQLLAARRLRIGSITMMDYEHQPANHLAFRLAGRVIVPEVYPESSARRQGAGSKLRRYRGLKEELTFAEFEPDPSFRATLGVADDDVVVALRPPPEGALYHRGSNPLFDAAVARVAASGAVGLLSPRDGEQGRRYGAAGGRVRVLDRAVDGANLLVASDLVVGAGGTMTREAAVLGVPSYTLFAGRPAAADQALIESGRLIRIASPRDLGRISIRRRPATPPRVHTELLGAVADLLIASAEELCAR